jgi:hypothetical protein
VQTHDERQKRVKESSATAGLASYLADAATQWAYMRPRQNDLEQIDKGRKIIYAIDTNILSFWANPDAFSRSGVDEETARIQLGTGQVFQSDPADLSSAISRGLAGFIFSKALSNPLLIIPPIHLEIEGLILALAQSTEVSNNGEIAEQIKAYEADLGKTGFTLEQLQEIAPRLQELLFHNLGTPSKVRRMSQILRERRAVTLSGLAVPKEVEEILRPTPALNGWVEYSKKRQGKSRYNPKDDADEDEGWDRRLQRFGHWKTTKLRDHDAEVLSRLEYWNERLADLERVSKGGRNYRILYLTADHRLLRAGACYKPKWSEHHFSEEILRHPRAFLDEEGVLRLIGRERQSESGHVANWFRLLVGALQMSEDERAQYVRKRSRIPSQFLDAAKKFGGGAESKAAELQTDWSTFTRDTVTANPPTPFDLFGLDTVRQHGANSLRDAVEKLDDEISRARLESLDSCISVMTTLGLELDFRWRHKARARAVMPIFFERWPGAEAFIQMVGTWGQDDFDRAAYDSGIRDLRKDDPTDYAYYLAHAALFAGRGRWRSGALLANRARESIRLIDMDQRNGSNGREAAYFEAACRRHSAKTISDLDDCPRLVNEAKKIFEDELRADASLDVAVERFDAELLACRLDRLLFIRFPTKGAPPNPVGDDSFAALSREYGQLLLKVEDRIAAAPSGNTAGGRNRSPIEVLKRLRTRLLMNLIALGLLSESNAEICGRAQYAIKVLEDLSNSHQLDVLDRQSRMFSIFYFWTATCGRIRMALGTPKEKRLVSTLEDFRLHEMGKSEDYEVFPYDRARFEEMRMTAAMPWPSGTEASVD